MDPQIDSIVVPLPEEAPVQEEVLPAQLVGAGRYRLTAAPFVAYDVACGDLVRCEPDADGRPVLQEVLERGGHLTARLLLDGDLDLMGRMKVLLGLKELGARAEDPRGRYYALDLGPDTDVDGVLDLLETHAEAGRLEYEVVEPE